MTSKPHRPTPTGILLHLWPLGQPCTREGWTPPRWSDLAFGQSGGRPHWGLPPWGLVPRSFPREGPSRRAWQSSPPKCHFLDSFPFPKSPALQTRSGTSGFWERPAWDLILLPGARSSEAPFCVPQVGWREGFLESLAWQGGLGSWWGWCLCPGLRGVYLLPTCLSHPCLC